MSYMLYPPNDALIERARADERHYKLRFEEIERQKFWIEFLKRNEELHNDLVVSVNELTSMLRFK